MKSFETDIKKYSEKIRLSAAEKRDLHARVSSYMEYHPRAGRTSVEKEAMRIPGIVLEEPFFIFKPSPFQLRIGAGVFAFLIMVAPFVAERAVPGDPLYLVKTGFNEPIQRQLATSPYEKIEFETKLMERRIAEARELASEGKLTTEVQAQIVENVKVHTNAVQTSIAELKKENADTAAIAQIAFNSSLEVQSIVLNADSGTGTTSPVGSILTAVNEARAAADTTTDDTTPSFEGLIAQVEQDTTRAYELFEQVKKTATTTEIADIERRLSDINRITLEAKDVHGTDHDTSVQDLTQSLNLIQKLILFMTDINIRETVSLDTLVPVVLSDAERTDLAKEEIRIIDERITLITQRLEVFDRSNAGLLEKVELGIDDARALVLKATTALEAHDVDTAEAMLKEAHALVDDLVTLTTPEEETKVPPVPSEDTVDDAETTTTTPEVTPEF